MAITAIEYSLIRNLRAAQQLPLGGDVLEIGEANWYGDVGASDLQQDIERYAAEEARGDLRRWLDQLIATPSPNRTFDIAKVFWATFLQPKSLAAIDFDGTAQALKLDLNEPLDLGRQFDLVLNLGTVEHVFNVAQAMKTIHEHTRPGGLMIHGMPLSGWVDHGFYNFQPTFYWDLAAANAYGLELAVYAQLEPLKLLRLDGRETIAQMARAKAIAENSLIYVVFRWPEPAAAFRAPMQGYYAGTLSAEAERRWTKDR